MAGTGSTHRRLVACLAAGALLFTGCGSEPSAGQGPTGAGDRAGGTANPADDIPSTTAADPEPSTTPTATTDHSPTGESTTEPTGPHFSESLVLDPWMNVSPSTVGYQADLEWLSANWTLNNHGEDPVLVALGVPQGLPVEGRRPEETVSPDQPEVMVWVTGGRDGRLRVSQQVFPMLEEQPGVDYAVPAALVDPGSGVGGHAMAMLPASASFPSPEIFLVPEPHGPPEDATEWEFCLQAAPVPDDLDPANPVIRHDTPGAGLLCSAPAQLPPDWATRPAPTGSPYRTATD